ncbi:MAG: pyrimidine 5'-nucleotidase [Alphaproteobacteria bacterium]|nr:pyrimidine 5'-nucleotidase [Alphaproteobacteria bacterium]
MTEPNTNGPSPDGLDHIDFWIFDLDNTLYRTTPEMLAQIDELMGSFIADFLGVDRVEARRIQKGYFRTHGLTLRGLMVEHGLNPQDYIEHLSQLDLNDVTPDPHLAETLAALDGRKFVYTNAFTEHTRDVMERIGITDHFDGVFDISDADFVPKPAIDSYRRLCDLHGIDPARAAMVEDIPRNLEPAAELGMTTVWVRTDTDWAKGITETGHIDHVTDDLTTWLKETIKRR